MTKFFREKKIHICSIIVFPTDWLYPIITFTFILSAYPSCIWQSSILPQLQTLLLILINNHKPIMFRIFTVNTRRHVNKHGIWSHPWFRVFVFYILYIFDIYRRSPCDLWHFIDSSYIIHRNIFIYVSHTDIHIKIFDLCINLHREMLIFQMLQWITSKLFYLYYFVNIWR